ncbi:unnamed protein product [Paramecium pentaurelia]|uniref:Tetratricopeptide repeat protein n=1 Tax=Paramecium pentaurelia TaxID=43138 RepID=A0A8S1YKW6_9CILI|nr:unnamed protein product [Paramecium pentaurelia]
MIRQLKISIKLLNQVSNEEKFYQRAMRFLMKKYVYGSFKDCKICIQISPKYSLAYMRCVKNAIENNDDALQYYNQVIEIDNKCILEYCNRGNLYKTKEIKIRQSQIIIRLLSWIHKMILHTRAEVLRLLNQIGIFLDKIGNQEEALLDFNKAIELDPYDCIYNKRGLLFPKIGSTKQALIDFNKALQLDPNCFDFYFDRGNLHQDIDNEQQVLVDYDKAIELNSNNYKAYNNRGVQIFIMKQGLQIITNQLNQILMMLILIITEVIENALLKYWKKMEAPEDYNKAIELNPNIAQFRLQVIIGLLHLSLGYKYQAIIDHDKAIQLDPKAVIDYFNRGNQDVELNMIVLQKYEEI